MNPQSETSDYSEDIQEIMPDVQEESGQEYHDVDTDVNMQEEYTQEVEAPPAPAEPVVDYKALLDEEKRLRQDEARRAEYYQNLATQSLQPPPQPQEPKYDPNDLAEYAGVEQIVNDRVGQIEQQLRAQVVERQVSEAKTKYSDWDVAFEAAQRVCANTPGLEDAIMKSQNPAETAYLIGRADPSVLQQATRDASTQAARQTVDKINSNLSNPQTINKAGGGSVKNTVAYYENISEDDLEQMILDVKNNS